MSEVSEALIADPDDLDDTKDRFSVPVIRKGDSEPSAMTVDEEQEEKKNRNIPRPRPAVQGRITRRTVTDYHRIFKQFAIRDFP